MIQKQNIKLRESIKLDDLLSRRAAEIKNQDRIEVMQDNLTIKPEILSSEILEFGKNKLGEKKILKTEQGIKKMGNKISIIVSL